MARNFLTSLRLVNISSDPPTGNEGELYYNTTTDKVRLYSNGAWIDLVAASAGSLFNVDAIAYPDYITFDTTPEISSASVGTISWDSGEGGLNSQISTNVNITLGQEVISLVYNAEATTLNVGEVVYLFGAQGQRPSVKRALNTSDTTSAKTFGMVAESIASGAEGFVVSQGIVKGVNTNAYNEGDILWLSNTAGQVTTTKPYAPNHMVFIGVVVKKNASSGRVFVKPQNGYEMDELHNVYAQSPSDNDILSYSSASTMWVKQNLATAIAEIDGTGSGIDADLLDGLQGSSYALVSGTLAQFAPTTSSQLAGVINDETGSGALVFATSPTLTTPNIGVATGTSFNSITGLSSTTPVMDGTAAVGTGTTVARADHVHASDTSRAPLASPTFTGTVTIPTLSLTQADTTTAASHYIVEIASDGLIRPKTLANVQTEIVTTSTVNAAAATTVGTITSGTWSATNIALNKGGTNASLTAANGGVVYSTASALAITAAGTAGQVLTSNGAAAPTWQSAASSSTTIDSFFLSGM